VESYGIFIHRLVHNTSNISSWVNYRNRSDRLEEKLFFSFLFCVRAQKKSDFFILEKPFFMQANPVFIMQTLCVCAGSKQILFFYN
jgi:hypothetical protein